MIFRWTVVIILLTVVTLCRSIVLKNEEVQKLINKLLEQVEKNPTDSKYTSTFILDDTFPLHVFIWNPIQKFELKLKCLPHNQDLCHAGWTSNVMATRSRLNPRLIYCVHHNIFLIQRIYKCSFQGKYCLFGATNGDLMDRVNKEIIKFFPFQIFPSAVYTHHLIDFIFEMLTSGNSFQRIVGSVLNLRAAEYSRSFGDIKDENLENVLVSFPPAGRLEVLFKEVYKNRRNSYQNLINHTVPELYVTVFQAIPLNKFVLKQKQGGKNLLKCKMTLFLALDEKGRVIAWQLFDKDGDQTSFDELLNHLSLKTAGIEYIIAEDCCCPQEWYNDRFRHISLKADLSSIIKYFTNLFKDFQGKEGDVKRCINDFNAIFEQENNVDECCQRTPDKDTLVVNLDNFVQKYQELIMTLTDNVIQELDEFLKKLKKHIIEGCLSGIKLDKDNLTEDDIEQLINNDCLRGIETVNYDVLMAVITLLFYYHNSRIDGKNSTNKKQSSVVFPPKHDDQTPVPINATAVQTDGIMNSVDEVFLEQTLRLMQTCCESLMIVKEMCVHRSFAMEKMLRSPTFTNDNKLEQDQHAFNLQYNLNSFNLEILPTEKDGDCCFRSILLQLYEKIESDNPSEQFQQYISQLNINKNIDNDIEVLRALFVDRLKTDKKYESFLLENELSDIEAFTRRGVFASNTGDFVVDACCQILQTPITIIQSTGRLSVYTFIPNECLRKPPLIIAYNVGENHYSSTRNHQEVINSEAPTVTSDTIMVDGSDVLNEKEKNQTFERENIIDDGKEYKCFCKKGCKENLKSSCPCFGAKRNCGIKCRCRNCENNKAVKKSSVGKCRCGSGQKKRNACVNTPGERGSKCPCLRSKQGCRECLCLGCANPFGVNQPLDEIVSENKKRPSLHSLIKEDKHTSIEADNWNANETVSLYVVAEVVRINRGEYCFDSICALFDFISKSTNIGLSVYNPKTKQEILTKLEYLGIF